MEILFLTTVLPGGRSTGGEIASHAVVDAIAAHGHAVTVVGYLRPAGNAQPGAGAVVVGRRSIEADAAPLVEKARWSASALVARLPVSAAK
ncbi:MAG: hypothetical protein QOC77_2532, partial [Thermoleophilaceae bacterium]|nr:hypothetical protein [Thermoleophilaceae bacterium]